MNKVTITPADTFTIKPHCKYFLVFKNAGTHEGELTSLNEALKKFFGEKKILAIFVSEFTEFKMYELMEEK